MQKWKTIWLESGRMFQTQWITRFIFGMGKANDQRTWKKFVWQRKRHRLGGTGRHSGLAKEWALLWHGFEDSLQGPVCCAPCTLHLYPGPLYYLWRLIKQPCTAGRVKWSLPPLGDTRPLSLPHSAEMRHKAD